MDNLEFEVNVGGVAGPVFPVSVAESPAGGCAGEMAFPFDTLALENRLQALEIALLSSGTGRRRVVPAQEQTVQEFGTALFDALFAGEVRTLYDLSRREAIQQRRGLRLRLRFDAPELAALPWEFLYDQRRAEYVCLSRDTPLLRDLRVTQPLSPLPVKPPLQILGMIASPTDLESLDVERERERVETATRDLQDRGQIAITWLESPTWRSLQQALRRGTFHVFHFVGHGGFDASRGEGLIALEDDDKTMRRLYATDLARLLGDHHDLRLALLNSCEGARADRVDVFSSTAAIVVRRGTPAVVAMQYAITDLAAIELARSFYEAIADGLAVDVALAEARKSVCLALSGTLEWGIPVLYLQGGDGVLFEIEESAAPEPAPAVHAAPEPEPVAADAVAPAPVVPEPVRPLLQEPVATPAARWQVPPAAPVRQPVPPPPPPRSTSAWTPPPPKGAPAGFGPAGTGQVKKRSKAKTVLIVVGVLLALLIGAGIVDAFSDQESAFDRGYHDACNGSFPVDSDPDYQAGFAQGSDEIFAFGFCSG